VVEVVICCWPWYRDTRESKILVCKIVRHVWIREGGVEEGGTSSGVFSVKRSISI